METKLKSARKAIGKTQLQLAQKVGISVTQYQNYEYDKNTPSVQTAICIAKALNTTVEVLFGTQ